MKNNENEIQKWKQLSTKRVLDDELLSVDEDIVQLPDGKQKKYVLHAPTETHSVIMVAINKKNEVLIQREYSYPPDLVMWQLPGGAMEAGESVVEAANRELAEESGFGSNNATEIGYFYVNNRKSNRKQHIVLCEDLYEHKIAEDEDEFIETHWFSVEQLQQMIQAGEFVNINLLAALNVWFQREKTKA